MLVLCQVENKSLPKTLNPYQAWYIIHIIRVWIAFHFINHNFWDKHILLNQRTPQNSMAVTGYWGGPENFWGLPWTRMNLALVSTKTITFCLFWENEWIWSWTWGSPESPSCFLPGTWKAPTLNWMAFEVSVEIVGIWGIVRSSRAALKYSSDFGENNNVFVMS